MTALAHTLILLTSLTGLATAILTLKRQAQARDQATRIEVLVNGDQARAAARLAQLTAALTAAGLPVPAPEEA